MTSNSHYATDFGVSSAEGAGNTKIGCLKARRWRAFKQPMFIMRIDGKWHKVLLSYTLLLRISRLRAF